MSEVAFLATKEIQNSCHFFFSFKELLQYIIIKIVNITILRLYVKLFMIEAV